MKIMISFLLTLALFSRGESQTTYRSGVFLHHSTGENIWGPNGSATSIPSEIISYNNQHGYSGADQVSMQEQDWPLNPWVNEWERWHRIFDNEDPNADLSPILSSQKIIVIKSCYPSSEMTGYGQASDTLNYSIKSVYNYKWHWRHMVRKMSLHPENFFVIWTNAPLVEGATNPQAAALSKSFTSWAKDTLAQGLDPETGVFPSNVYVFHYFEKLTDENGYEQLQYAVSNTDSHPNAAATALVAPQFVTEIFDAAIAYEQAGTILSVTPISQSVSANAGSVTYSVQSNTSWTAQCDADWCTVTPSGSGNGIITASYTENQNLTDRTATITVSATEGGDQLVTLQQAGITANLQVEPEIQIVNPPAGTTYFAVTSNTNWNVECDASWCTTAFSGFGNGVIDVSYAANPSTQIRTANLIISAWGISPHTVQVIQSGLPVAVEKQELLLFEAYPNPSTGEIHLYYDNLLNRTIDVIISNQAGKLIYVKSFRKGISEIINLEESGKGVYTLRISDNKSLIFKRIIII
ncbi:MAG: T9SS type A sorting domain-containing protein [Lentimicrobiaceae bacterium]|nr:T9SS type A sorting domain-containing protein [Lentimicrobiaceae bacterium]MCO5265687.1 T9SS type A sorting domain-containing protein [Lentimicrobium sp.]